MTNPPPSDLHSAATVYWRPESNKLKPVKAKLVNIDGFLDHELNKIIVPLEDTEQTIGRDESNTVCVPYRKISRHHLRIFPDSGHWVVEDLESTNGMLINGEKMKAATLNHGDVIKIGSLSFLYQVEEDSSPTQHFSERNQTISGDDGNTTILPASKRSSLNEDETVLRPSAKIPDRRPRNATVSRSGIYRKILITILIAVSLFLVFTILRVLGVI